MNTNNLVARTVAIFAALAVAGIGIALGARNLVNTFDQTILVAIGSALFGAALAFFLIRVFSLIEK